MGYPDVDLGKPMIGTANTMGCVAEAPGMMLPGTAVIPSVGPH
jgi:dihydroxyacid dehydratase/phosphogluconate dehydratase